MNKSTGVTIAGVLIFTPFLPRSKQECKDWKQKGKHLFDNVLLRIFAILKFLDILTVSFEGEEIGSSELRGYIALFLCIATTVVIITLLFTNI